MQTRFETSSQHFGDVGHTHAPIDQRLWVAMSTVKNAGFEELQTPNDSFSFPCHICLLFESVLAAGNNAAYAYESNGAKRFPELWLT